MAEAGEREAAPGQAGELVAQGAPTGLPPPEAESALEADATGQPVKKQNLESVPDLFVVDPEAKRRAEQELAYNTLKECVVELRWATNGIKGSNHKDIRDAIVTSQKEMEVSLERVLRGMDVTHGGIQYNAGQLSGGLRLK